MKGLYHSSKTMQPEETYLDDDLLSSLYDLQLEHQTFRIGSVML